MPTVKVNLGPRSYPVIISKSDWQRRLTSLLQRNLLSDGQLFIVYDARVYALHGKRINRQIRKSGIDFAQLVVPSGEKTKSRSQLAQVHSFLLEQKITRSDFILACGGGVTTDLAGFAAATTLRGVPWGIIATSLLGMVDAAIGGKTGINHPRGKNLLGAFWQPTFVIADTEFLHTLPERQLINGLGEVVKYGGLIGAGMLNRLENYIVSENLYADSNLARLITESVKYKADIVSRDEREGNLRMVLNLGHTFGHAIERSLEYRKLHHGEAVLLGLLAAVELSVIEELTRLRKLETFRKIIRQFVSLIPRHRLECEVILDWMSADKKRVGRRAKFVLLEAPGRPIIVTDPKPGNVRKALRATLSAYDTMGDTHA